MEQYKTGSAFYHGFRDQVKNDPLNFKIQVFSAKSFGNFYLKYCCGDT